VSRHQTAPTMTRPLRVALVAAAAFLAFELGPHHVGAEEAMPISPRGSRAASSSDDSDHLAWSSTSMALGGTLAVVILGLVLVRKVVPGFAAAGRGGPIEVLCQTPLGTRGTVFAVRCGSRVLIVGATSGQVCTLTEITDPNEVAPFLGHDVSKADARSSARAEAANATPASGLKGQLHGMLDKIETWNSES
jgi:flagellar biogenesis protein FliO